MTLPKSEEARKAGKQDAGAADAAAEQARNPLLVALGAGELAAKAVADALGRARQRAESTRHAVGDLPQDLSGLREKFDPAELRKLVDEYTEAAMRLYQKLAEEGEATLERLRTNPQVKKAIDGLEEAVHTAQERVGVVAGDARAVAEDVLARVTRKTRAVGEKAAQETEELATDLAEAVVEAGGEVAHEVRSTTRRVADKTAPTRKPAASRGATTGKAAETDK